MLHRLLAVGQGTLAHSAERVEGAGREELQDLLHDEALAGRGRPLSRDTHRALLQATRRREVDELGEPLLACNPVLPEILREAAEDVRLPRQRLALPPEFAEDP